MGLLSKEVRDNKLIINVPGRIDAGNASTYEEELLQLKEGEDGKEIILDLDDLEYISSAGLRVVLRLLKDCPTLKLINVSNEVYQIFEMTGFTEMVDIEKGFRKLSVEGCEVIGRGAKGTVYRLNEDTIIKVYNSPDSLPDIKKERELARKAFVLGVPTAISYDVVRVGNSYGSVFELLSAKSYSELIRESIKNSDEYVDEYAATLRKIHSTEVKESDMPDVKNIAYKWYEEDKKHLTNEEGEKLKKLIDDVPNRLTMIHGDYHSNNLMLQNGETMIIDMDTLSHGHPVFELANMYVAHILFGVVDKKMVENFLRIDYETSVIVWDKFIHFYFDGKTDEEIDKIMDKVKLLGNARLLRHVSRRGINNDIDQKTFDISLKNVKELLEKVDTLDF